MRALRALLVAALAAALFSMTACSSQRKRARGVSVGGPERRAPGEIEIQAIGIASFYSDRLAGRPTASGEPYDPDAMTCAHRTLPLGTEVEVRAFRNGASAVCRINDRGPYVKGRIIDLSRAMGHALGIEPNDIIKVEIRVLD